MEPEIDLLIQELEAHGLSWDIGHLPHIVEARVWKWPHVIGRYRVDKIEPAATMLAKAMMEIDWRKYPKLK